MRLPRIRRAFRDYVRTNRIEVVNCTMSHLWNAAVAPVIRSAGAQFVLTLHDAVPHPGENYLVRKSLLGWEIAESCGVITLSRHVQDQLCAVYGYPRARSWIVPHGVFQHGPKQPRKFPRSRPFRLLFFGRILPYKGLNLLAAAFQELRREFPSLELIVAGQGDLAFHAPNLTGTSGVSVYNRWVPETEIGAILKDVDAVVAPYTEASQSGVIPTAFGVGLPAVVTPVGGLTEQVRHMETGLVAERPSSEALVATIKQLISNPALYERLSNGALGEARESLSWRAIADQIAGIVKSIAERPLRGSSLEAGQV